MPTPPEGRWAGALVAPAYCSRRFCCWRRASGPGSGCSCSRQRWRRTGGARSSSVSIALQNLVWGASQLVAGILADRLGAKPLILGGAVLYAAGLWAMAQVGGAAAFISARAC